MIKSIIPANGGDHILCDGPLCEHVETYRAQINALGYKPATIRWHLKLIAKFDRWLARRGHALCELDDELIERFVEWYQRKAPYQLGVRAVLRRLLEELRKLGALPVASKPSRIGALDRIIEEYRGFLLQERGLVCSSVDNYSRYAKQFLREGFGTARLKLSRLSAADLSAFVQREAERLGRGHAKHATVALRSFLRFAQLRGYIRAHLATAVPTVAQWAMDSLPKYLPPGAVQRVLDGCERTAPVGKRDYAILLLLARLGLRAGEVSALRLEDIDWENGRITVFCKKSGGPAHLPLPTDVGEAIAQYLKDSRPRCSCRNVFVRTHAPHAPFSHAAVVSGLAKRALQRAGVKSARQGAHLFRHTLATEMLRHGASLGEIGQVLRHKDPNTTAIYAKVDVNALRELALPWPGGVQ
jgi:integrase